MKASAAAAAESFRLRDIAELTKSGITAMVVVSTATGMLLATTEALPWTLWLHTLVGTALVAAGASALNQVVEREVDGRMERTAQRPLPAGRMSPDAALVLGTAFAVVGLFELAVAVDLLAATLAGATLVGYVFLYTPLKRRSSLATIVGAVPGATPPLIGWAAARGELGLGAWVLFAVLFLWQMPHFLSIAWLYRDDYARGGFPLLSIGDEAGLRTARQALFYCAALVPVSLLPPALGLSGPVYFVGAFVLGVWFFVACSRFALERSSTNARRLMVASILYLPAVLAVLVIDRLFVA